MRSTAASPSSAPSSAPGDAAAVRRLRILLWGINYTPETTGIAPFNTGLAEFLAEQGHEVEVVTAFPYYPQWRKQPADRGRLFRTQQIRGVTVHRCYLYLPGKVNALRRIVHELSFGLSSFVRVLTRRRADIYVVVSPPLGLGLFAWIATRLKRSRYVFHVQDLQPDAAVGLGMLRAGGFVRMLYGLERLAYRHAAAVSGIAPGMIEAFARKGVGRDRCILFPNWLRDSARARAAAGFRARQGIEPSHFLAVYSGNLGRKQGIEILLEAARLLAASAAHDPAAARVRILIVGAGAAREELEEKIARLALPNLRLLPLLDDGDYAAMLDEADAGLITQAAGTGGFFFPSKLLTVLHAGLPVLTVADAASELAHAVAHGGFGLNSPPDEPQMLADNLRRASADPRLCAALAEGTAWVERFDPALVLPQFARQLETIARPDLAASAAVAGAERAVARW
jgi:colanic acid biosynthesis glycosyl transferase WcaI